VGLLGGPAFFVAWFTAAQTLYFGRGGEVQATRADYGSVAASHASEIRIAATMLVVAAGPLLLFGSALRSQMHAAALPGRVASGCVIVIALLLVVQGSLAYASLEIASEDPADGWLAIQLSDRLGFESFAVSLVAAMALLAAARALGKEQMTSWLWWTTNAAAVVLGVGGLLEGSGVVPAGRFAILFALWAAVAGSALALRQPTDVDPDALH